MSYLRLVALKDDLAFIRIINVPSRHLGPVSLEKIKQTAKEHNVCLFDALSFVKLAGERQDCLTKFKDDILGLMECSNSESIVELINKVVDIFQLKDWYDNDEERIENMEELVHSVMLYVDYMQSQNKKAELKDYLQDVALYTNIDQEFDKESVRLMTIHQAKGLEFPCVFVCGLTDGVLPSRRTLEESGKVGLEEERRLMYVALTRAKDKLYLTDSKGFSYYGEKGRSRFVGEVKKEHLDIRLGFDTFDVYNKDVSFKGKKVQVKHNDELFINNEFGKDQYHLPKVNDKKVFKRSRNITIGDIIMHNNIFGEVYEYSEFGIKCHTDENIAHDVVWHETNMGLRLVMHPIENRIYWGKDNNKLKLFVYKQTVKTANGILLVGENEEGEFISLRADEFCTSKYIVLKQEITVLKNAYAKITLEDERISVNASIANTIRNPFSQLNVPMLGDIVKIHKKMYFFVKRENGNIVCEKISNHKQIILQESDEMEVIARPYKDMFYRSNNIYYYFNAVKMFGSRPSFTGISIERGKCRTSYMGINQVQKKNMSPCSEKEFWENCKDRFGYICFRYNIK